MTLASTDTADNPVVDINYPDTKTDQEVAIQSYKRAIELVRAAGYVSGPEPVPLSGDDEILDFVRNNSSPFYHATGTCMLSPHNLHSYAIRMRVLEIDYENR